MAHIVEVPTAQARLPEDRRLPAVREKSQTPANRVLSNAAIAFLTYSEVNCVDHKRQTPANCACSNAAIASLTYSEANCAGHLLIVRTANIV